MVNCINLTIEKSPRFILGRENVPCVAEVVNRSLKADCTDYTSVRSKFLQGEGGTWVVDEVGGNSEGCLKLFGGRVEESLLKLLKRVKAGIVRRWGRS